MFCVVVVECWFAVVVDWLVVYCCFVVCQFSFMFLVSGCLLFFVVCLFCLMCCCARVSYMCLFLLVVRAVVVSFSFGAICWCSFTCCILLLFVLLSMSLFQCCCSMFVC